MLRVAQSVLAVLIVIAAGASSAHAQDVAAGEKVFAKCKACHSPVAGKNGVGPSQFSIIGRPAGTVEGFKYSDAVKNSGITWTEDKIHAFLIDPKATIPGNKMVFPGLKNEQERNDLIAYLKTLK